MYMKKLFPCLKNIPCSGNGVWIRLPDGSIGKWNLSKANATCNSPKAKKELRTKKN
ncbi:MULTISPECIES: hypothetical protein [Butyricimonas]|uniref:DUF3873 domain-containing protein n=1 Tax=Butyricimonas hominis TaxID=2763032 RepID=A0ABR7D0W4_9BACT|nr:MULTISPECIES: hypothetical protein [Butyricimonas]MBC5621160.1 hypothetical protein [Butyricimonas hominis]MCB6972025.1 hypothetical protein [Butyricimonas synergistica]MCG4519033.1 hypothetical protein [Butyricimonas sp. DFI.6.44]